MSELNELNDELNDDFLEELFIDSQDIRILKAIITDPKVARSFCTTYDSSLFVGSSQRFAKSVIDYFKTYQSIPTKRVLLETAANDTQFLHEIEEITDRLTDTEYNASEFGWDLDKIKDRYTKKEISSLKSEIDAAYDKPLDEILTTLKQKIDKTQSVRTGKEQTYTQKTLKEFTPEFQKEYVAKAKNPELGVGVLTGFSYIDFITNGLVPSDMLIIGAETGSGKSLMLSNIAIQMWMQKNTIDTPKKEYTPGNNVLYFSLEMPYDQCYKRAFSKIASVPYYALRDAKISDNEQLKRLNQSAKFIHYFPNEFEIVDIPRGVTIEQIEERYLESVARGNDPKIIVVDYIGLMEDKDKQSDDWLKLGHISAKLHEFGRRYGLIILSAVQLNRAKGKSPAEQIGIHRIGRSSLIMHNASIGIQIETRDQENTYGDMLYHIIKNRNGELGKHYLTKKLYMSTLIDNKYEPESYGYEFSNHQIDDLSDKLKEIGWF